jgi:hypothetical protein
VFSFDAICLKEDGIAGILVAQSFFKSDSERWIKNFDTLFVTLQRILQDRKN